MLESATIRRPGMVNGQYDVGRILETMLYYGHVHLVLDAQLFIGLTSVLGLARLSTLLQHDRITSEFTPEFVCIRSTRSGSMLFHQPGLMTNLGLAPRVSQSPKEKILNNLRNIPGYDGTSLKEVSRVLRKSRDVKLDRILGGQTHTDRLFFSLATDVETLRMAAMQFAQAPTRTGDIEAISRLNITSFQSEDGVMIHSDVDISSLVSEKDGSPIGWAQILSVLNEYNTDLLVAHARSSDVIGTSDISDLAVWRTDLALARSARSAAAIGQFEEFVFEDAGAFGASVNSGAISFEDALRHIDRSTKFRAWLDKIPPDSEIIDEYTKALAKDGVFDRAPASLARFAFFAGAGVAADLTFAGGAGTAAGLGLSVFDSFVVQKIAAGWKPNVFVKNTKKVIEPKSVRI